MLIDTKVDSRSVSNKQILSFLLKVASYKTKRLRIVMLTQTT